MAKHLAQPSTQLETSDVFDPAIRLNVIGELAYNPAYKTMTTEEQALHRDNQIVQRTDMVDNINRFPGYQERLAQLDAAMAPSAEVVTDAREEYLLQELEVINARRRRMGERALDMSYFNN